MISALHIPGGDTSLRTLKKEVAGFAHGQSIPYPSLRDGQTSRITAYNGQFLKRLDNYQGATIKDAVAEAEATKNTALERMARSQKQYGNAGNICTWAGIGSFFAGSIFAAANDMTGPAAWACMGIPAATLAAGMVLLQLEHNANGNSPAVVAQADRDISDLTGWGKQLAHA